MVHGSGLPVNVEEDTLQVSAPLFRVSCGEFVGAMVDAGVLGRDGWRCDVITP